MELESAILNFKRHAQTAPDKGTCQATDNMSGSVENRGTYIPVLLKSFKAHAGKSCAERVSRYRLPTATKHPQNGRMMEINVVLESGHTLAG